MGSVVSSYNRLTGSNLNTLPKGWGDMYKETIGRQGAQAQVIRDGYVDPIVDMVTEGNSTPEQIDQYRQNAHKLGVDFLAKYPQYDPDKIGGTGATGANAPATPGQPMKIGRFQVQVP
jgi:hypothetical protein